MTEQLAIDFTKRARRVDPATSKTAAGRAAEFAHGHHAIIVGDLVTRGPGTYVEIAERTGLDRHAVARRLKELERGRVVERMAETRPSPSGRDCAVWRAR